MEEEKKLDTFRVIYSSAPNPDGASKKDETDISFDVVNLKDFKNVSNELRLLGWRINAADGFFSEEKNRLQRILSGKVKYLEHRERGNIEFFLNKPNSQWTPSMVDRFKINPMYIGTMTDEEIEKLSKTSGIPTFIFDKIKDGMLLNFGICTYIHTGYKKVMGIDKNVSDFWIESEIENPKTEKIEIDPEESAIYLAKIKLELVNIVQKRFRNILWKILLDLNGMG